jgi:tRNA-dihydrouridine synthase
VDVPAVVSGDVTSRARAQAILATTGASAVMVGRAAQGNPWATGFLKEVLRLVPQPWPGSRRRSSRSSSSSRRSRKWKTRLLAAAPGADQIVARLESEVHEGEDDVVLDLPISIYGGG